MARIQVLDAATANQIAAGEVVERPASVVKELVENSLDAGATRITITVEGGGRDRIRVVDNGCGMEPEDARLALERHATSKIRTGADLAAVHTLGFRGEALPAIASVSRLTLRTRVAAALAGTQVEVEGGEVRSVEPCGCAPGTAVEVRDLFFNTPARLKYLKTGATEGARIGDVVARLALSRPDVAVRSVTGAQEACNTPGNGDLLAAAAAVLGRDLARKLVPVEMEAGACRIHGYTGLPDAARAGRSLQFFFVNGRAVTALPLRYALEEAYANLIPQGRYPVCVLFVDLDPAAVDVNVHPAKLEVRFQEERAVRGSVYRAARAALAQHLVVPGAFGNSAGPGAGAADGAAAGSVQPGRDWGDFGRGLPPWRRPAHAAGQGAVPLGAGYLAGADAPAGGGSRPAEAPAPYGEVAATLSQAAPDQAPPDPEPLHRVPDDPGEVLRRLRPLGQVHRTYVVCEGPGGLYILDQHAAHERVFFEAFLRTAAAQAIPSQPLLFPATLDLTAAQRELVGELAPVLAESGIQLQPFGGRTVLLQAIPAGVPEAQAVRLVTDLLDRLAEEGQVGEGGPLERRRRVLAALAACRAAIKAGDALQPEELVALLADLAACDQPGRCPHGRPTVICIGKAELEKRFGRA